MKKILSSLLCLHCVAGFADSQTPPKDNVSVFADFIYWTARESGSDVWAEVITSKGSSYLDELRAVKFGWDPGLKVGLNYTTKHDAWDITLAYTWFHTRGTDHVTSSPGTVHSSFTGGFLVDNTVGLGITGPTYESAQIAWKIDFNIFDWELGRKYQVLKSLSLRPFFGLKGGWIYQSIYSSWFNPDLTDFPGAQPFSVGHENLKNDFWGIGPSFGVNSEWFLYSTEQQALTIFGDVSGALMYGHWSFQDVYKNDISQKINVGSSSINGGATMARCILGLGWNVGFNKGRYLLSSKVGYELQFWLDQLQYYSFTGGRLVNALTLQGGTLELNFAF